MFFKKISYKYGLHHYRRRAQQVPYSLWVLEQKLPLNSNYGKMYCMKFMIISWTCDLLVIEYINTSFGNEGTQQIQIQIWGDQKMSGKDGWLEVHYVLAVIEACSLFLPYLVAEE